MPSLKVGAASEQAQAFDKATGKESWPGGGKKGGLGHGHKEKGQEHAATFAVFAVSCLATRLQRWHL